VDNVEDYVASRAEVEGVLKNFQEMISYVHKYGKLCATELSNARRKYQFMQVNTERRAGGLREKIPDIQKTLETVKFLKTRDVGTLRCTPVLARGTNHHVVRC
jgi:hypothetical protein